MKRPIVIILAVAGVLRFALLAGTWGAPKRLLMPDSAEYLELSNSLACRGAFERGDRPEVFRTPGYPLLLMTGLPFGPAGWRAVAVLQVVIDVALVYLTYLLGAAMCSRCIQLLT